VITIRSAAWLISTGTFRRGCSVIVISRLLLASLAQIWRIGMRSAGRAFPA